MCYCYLFLCNTLYIFLLNNSFFYIICCFPFTLISYSVFVYVFLHLFLIFVTYLHNTVDRVSVVVVVFVVNMAANRQKWELLLFAAAAAFVAQILISNAIFVLDGFC